jgi:hypothetical protein
MKIINKKNQNQMKKKSLFHPALNNLFQTQPKRLQEMSAIKLPLRFPPPIGQHIPLLCDSQDVEEGEEGGGSGEGKEEEEEERGKTGERARVNQE